ncbi:MAG: hypothetical protein LBD48_14555 [Treponema sp.]|jgi:hypothetical protein|nr:hypothetical protein [Treponema sp.]
MNSAKIMMMLIAGLALLASPLAAQVPSAVGSTTNQKSASGGRFGGDIDNYMDTKGYGGIGLDRHFFFIGGRYQGRVTPALGYAAKLDDYYLGVYFRGTIVQGDNTHHNAPWDSNWDKDGNGSSKFTLNDNVAVLLGVPKIGGFRFDWIASDETGTTGPAFEKFKGVSRTYNGETITFAEGEAAGSMSFVLSYGNTFAGRIKADAALGFATPDTLKVTGGQVGTDSFKFTQTKDTRVYIKLGGGYTLNSTSSVDGDYSLILMPGMEWEQTKGAVETSRKDSGNSRHLININYSKTFNWDDKISMKIKPNVAFNILAEQEVYETESASVDNGKQTTLTVLPTIALGVQYKPSGRLSFYTGTTITLFDLSSKTGEKGADGAAWGDGNSSTDIIQGSEAGLELGTSFALSDTLTLDFNARQLITGIFQSAPMVDLFLTFKK